MNVALLAAGFVAAIGCSGPATLPSQAGKYLDEAGALAATLSCP
jgi:hypothetical protein